MVFLQDDIQSGSDDKEIADAIENIITQYINTEYHVDERTSGNEEDYQGQDSLSHLASIDDLVMIASSRA